MKYSHSVLCHSEMYTVLWINIEKEIYYCCKLILHFNVKQNRWDPADTVWVMNIFNRLNDKLLLCNFFGVKCVCVCVSQETPPSANVGVTFNLWSDASETLTAAVYGLSGVVSHSSEHLYCGKITVTLLQLIVQISPHLFSSWTCAVRMFICWKHLSLESFISLCFL